MEFSINQPLLGIILIAWQTGFLYFLKYILATVGPMFCHTFKCFFACLFQPLSGYFLSVIIESDWFTRFKVLFWSGTRELTHAYSGLYDRFTTLEDTLAG